MFSNFLKQLDIVVFSKRYRRKECISSGTSVEPITLKGSRLKEAESFTSVGRISDTQGGADADVKVRIGKERTSGTWWWRTTIRIFNSRAKAVLHYDSQTWRKTKTTINEVRELLISTDQRRPAITICGWGHNVYQQQTEVEEQDRVKHLQTCFDMEPWRDRVSSRHQETGIHLVPDRKERQRLRTLDVSSGQPAPVFSTHSVL